MTASKFIVIRAVVKALLSGLLVSSLCYAVLFGGTSEGGISLLAGLVGVILQHYFQRDTDSPVDNGTREPEPKQETTQ